MKYEELTERAIENNEMEHLLCGKKPYEVEVSEFTSDVFPTDINTVLVNCIYKQFFKVNYINEIFISCLEKMLDENACKTYIAILYFDACIFQEERGKASFLINRGYLAQKIKTATRKFQIDLQNTITFENGMKKNKAMNNIINFNSYYEKKYGFSIV